MIDPERKKQLRIAIATVRNCIEHRHDLVKYSRASIIVTVILYLLHIIAVELAANIILIFFVLLVIGAI